MIDAYLTGQLSPEENSRFLESLEQDPALKEEFLLQQSTVKALQEHRRMALKARLDAVEVGTGFSFASASGVKLAAGTALVAILGTAAYFGYNELNQPAPAEYQVVLSTEEDFTSTSLIKEELPALPKAEKPTPPASAATQSASAATQKEIAETILPKPSQETEIKSEEKQVLLKEEGSSGVAEKEIEKPLPNPARPNSAEVVKPDVLTDFEETDITTSTPEAEVPEDQLAGIPSFDNSTIAVSTKSDSRYDFHYRFFENQLQIFGNFRNVPYEVLEVNTGLSTRYFLYHKGNYFELKPNQQKVTRLQELTDKKTIKELEITRTEKLNK